MNLCKRFFVALQFYCNEPQERHCPIPIEDTEHYKSCDLAHHKFTTKIEYSFPPTIKLNKHLH
jgi:hypothetical protein